MEFGIPAFDFDTCIEHIPSSKLSLRFYDLEHKPDTLYCPYFD